MIDVSSVTLRMFLENPLDVPLLQWALFLTALLFLGTCIYLHMKDDSIDLRWLIMERMNKPSLPKIGQVVALLVSTWGFVILVMKGELTETYFMCYMSVWSGSAALETYFNRGTRGARRSGDQYNNDRGDRDDHDGRDHQEHDGQNRG